MIFLSQPSNVLIFPALELSLRGETTFLEKNYLKNNEYLKTVDMQYTEYS